MKAVYKVASSERAHCGRPTDARFPSLPLEVVETPEHVAAPKHTGVRSWVSNPGPTSVCFSGSLPSSPSASLGLLTPQKGRPQTSEISTDHPSE